MPIEFPSFELQASPSALQQLTRDIDGWRVDRIGSTASKVWLQTSDGAVWLIGISQRKVRPLFEVSTLGMLSMSELHQRWERWEPPVPPKDLPEGFRKLLVKRPPPPTAPTNFNPWPFRSWRTEVVRRREYSVESENAAPKFSDHQAMQTANDPRSLPVGASAFCEVAAGVLFTGDNGRRLLLAVDWMPMNMLVVENAADVGTFNSACELVSMDTYCAADLRAPTTRFPFVI